MKKRNEDELKDSLLSRRSIKIKSITDEVPTEEVEDVIEDENTARVVWDEDAYKKRFAEKKADPNLDNVVVGDPVKPEEDFNCTEIYFEKDNLPMASEITQADIFTQDNDVYLSLVIHPKNSVKNTYLEQFTSCGYVGKISYCVCDKNGFSTTVLTTNGTCVSLFCNNLLDNKKELEYNVVIRL